jgi:outer membrane protein
MGNTGRSRFGAKVTLLMCALILTATISARADDAAVTQAPVITLTQFVDQALKAGPGIRLSDANLATAQAQYTTAAARNALGLDASGGLSHSDQNAGSSAGASPSDSLQAGLSLTAPLGTSVSLTASHSLTENTTLDQTSSLSVNAGATLWDGYVGGTGSATVQQASLTLQQTQATEATNRTNIAYQVKQAYYSLLAAQRQLTILQQTLLKRQEEMKKTQALYDAESANQIDLKQAQINQRQAELDLAKAQGNIEVEHEQLSALVGWSIDKAYTVAEVDDPAVPSLDVAAAVKTALEQRSDMKQMQLKLAANAISVALAQAQGSVQVKANAGIDLSQDWTAGSGRVGWSAGVQVALPILDAGATAAAVQQATLATETISVQKEQLAASIATDVKNAVYNLRDLLARVELAQSSLELAQNQYDLAKLQFDSGVASNLDVLGASVSLTTAQVSLAKARSDAQLGVLALQNTLGN